MTRLILALLLLLLPAVAAAQPASCSTEATLQGRTDVLHCEPWESSTWWQNGYKGDGTKSSPPAATSDDVANTEIVSSGCISGSCLRVNMAAYQSGALAIHWPLANAGGAAPTELHLRYYLKLGETFNPRLCQSGNTEVDNGGKFPGLADVRTDADASGQCGNGGNYADGINCWSGRLKFRNCLGTGDSDICAVSGTAFTRLGWYWYVPPALSANNQEFGAFDNQSWGTTNATCSAGPLNMGSTGSDSTSCGKGAAGLVNGVWYRVDLYVKMNTVGSANGIARAHLTKAGDSTWSLKYEKTNMEFRVTGHDNLHVRTIWLNVHAGGEFMGLCTSSYIMLDQLAAATAAPLGAFKASGDFVSNPFTVSVATSNPFSGLAGGQWQEVANTKIRTVIPSGPTGNPDAIVDAYSGGTIDTLRHRFIIWGGGHSDYSGSEVYAIDMANASVARIVESSSNPVSRHTYGAMAYVEHTDQVYSSGGGTYPNGNVDNTTWLLNLSAGPPPTWTHDTDSNPMQLSYGTISRYDSVTQKVYIYDRDDLYTYNVSTGAYSGILQTGPHFSLDASGVIDTLRRRLVMVDGGQLYYINLDSPYAQGTITTTSNPSELSNRSPGLSYDIEKDKIVLWAGGNSVYTVSGAGGAWAQVATNTGPNTAQTSTGTYGRWAYEPTYKVHALVNDIDQNLFVFKLP